LNQPTELDAIQVADTSGVAAALEAAQPAAKILDQQLVNDVLVIAERQDGRTHQLDLERYLPDPARSRGTVQALTAAGFVASFKHRSTAWSVIYADTDQTCLVAVLNDDDDQTPGWRDHRITYTPQPTPEWRHWTTHQGLHSQDVFARALEEGETEIRNPSATVMLELAETFHASVGAKFKQAGRRTDGRTQLVYEEEIEATAGEGMAEIPDSFTIEVRPFYGARAVEVVCRLRYRLNRGELQIGYRIHRPDEIVRHAFDTDVVGSIRDQLPDILVVEGVPADALQPGR
jgi:uncharacterized protein YfdQ (DUF2303 family)